MNFLLGISIGLSEIRAHKFRSFLTMLGIILGVASLMAMFALTAGIAKGMRDNLQAIGGVEQVGVNTKEASPKAQPFAGISPGRTLQDAVALRTHAPLVAEISPEATEICSLARGSVNSRAMVTGVTSDYLSVNNHQLAVGRFFCDLDSDNHARVAVIGAAIARQLWPEMGENPQPIGKTFYINERPFIVVGVLTYYERDEDRRRRELGISAAQQARREQRSGQPANGWRRDPFWWKNNAVVVPLSTMFMEFRSAQVDEKGNDAGPDYKLDRLLFRVADMSRFEEAISQASAALLINHRGIDDFGFDTREDRYDQIESSVRATRVSGGLISGISLLVGGIGITNIMLASIAERVREIGIRRSVGARRRDIFVQILVESVVTAVLGGLLGLAAAFGLVRFLIALAPAENAPLIEGSSAVVSFCFAFVVGIIAGLYPAWKAASLDPITALRYE